MRETHLPCPCYARRLPKLKFYWHSFIRFVSDILQVFLHVFPLAISEKKQVNNICSARVTACGAVVFSWSLIWWSSIGFFPRTIDQCAKANASLKHSPSPKAIFFENLASKLKIHRALCSLPLSILLLTTCQCSPNKLWSGWLGSKSSVL